MAISRTLIFLMINLDKTDREESEEIQQTTIEHIQRTQVVAPDCWMLLAVSVLGLFRQTSACLVFPWVFLSSELEVKACDPRGCFFSQLASQVAREAPERCCDGLLFCLGSDVSHFPQHENSVAATSWACKN